MTQETKKPKHHDKTTTSGEEGQWFGYEKIDPSDKAKRVKSVFDSVAKNYDLMNDLMSGGIHRLWKIDLIHQIRPQKNTILLDVAGGTGDVAQKYQEATRYRSQAIMCDINEEMLKVGRDRARNHNKMSGMSWVTGDAMNLPLPDKSVDVYTISFGLRNVTHIDEALKEAYRVLKPGGKFFCLEFSKVNTPVLKQFYDLYSFKILPQIGQIVAKDKDSYEYLVESIRQFPEQDDLKRRMQEVGFDQCKWRNLTGGIAAIHSGWRL